MDWTTRGHRDRGCLTEGRNERSMPFPAALVSAVKESRALLGSIPARRHHVSLTVFTLALALSRGSRARSDLASGCELGTSFPLEASSFSATSTLIRPQEVILGFFVSLVFCCVQPGSAPC